MHQGQREPDAGAPAAPVARARRAAAERSGRQVRAVLDASPNAALLVGLDGTIVFASRQVERLLGYPPAALAGQPVDVLVPETARIVHGPLRDAFVRAGQDRDLGLRTNLSARRADGTVVPVDIALSLVELEEGRRVVVHVIDGEPRRLLEARLLQAQRMELMGRFANMLAHDMRNHLNAIAGLADLARVDREDGVGDDELRMIAQVVGRADQAITTMLGIGRPAGVSSHGTDVPAFLAATHRILEQLALPACSIAIEAPDPLPAVAIDPGALSQILMNLVTNARDAMPDGGPIVIGAAMTTLGASAGPGPAPDPPPAVAVSVRDRGHGMDEATRARIFEPFFSTRRPGEGGSGSGLGLASVEMLVARAGGRIRVDSVAGSGSCFEIVLPLAAGAAR